MKERGFVMNNNLLLELTTELGYDLAMAGAETYRIEESIIRIMAAYGIHAEAFAIPNCLTVSIVTADDEPMTRMRRIGYHGNDLDTVEKYNDLSRRICAEHPDPLVARTWLEETKKSLRRYDRKVMALGYFLGAFGFAPTFGGTFLDALWAGVCGLVVMGIDTLMDKFHSTLFFRTILSAFCASGIAYIIHALGLMDNVDASIIGTLMLLVPGLLFTNAMRDIMYGDTNSGLHRMVQVLLIAAAIALGTAAALYTVSSVTGIPTGSGLQSHNILISSLACFLGCIGFGVVFNIHGPGTLVCAAGGVLTWVVYLTTKDLSGSLFFANLVGGVVASFYAEIMARIRKYPAISYLVVSIFPLIPGAGVYYTMNYAVQREMSLMAYKGYETAAIAGAIALGILLVSTIFRMHSNYAAQKMTK